MALPKLERPVFLPEWLPQDAVLMAWPHTGTDWASNLPEVQQCYHEIAKAIADDETLIIVTPHVDSAKAQLADLNQDNIRYYNIDTNDTWTRDYGPLTVSQNGQLLLLDFKFNAWGLKFAADKDNLVNQRLDAYGAFNAPLANMQDLVLEGGSVEVDDNGTILTTAKCLLSPNRNGGMDKHDIEKMLTYALGANRVVWLEHGELLGDDTDGHIDTIARLTPRNWILYSSCENDNDGNSVEMQRMNNDLREAFLGTGYGFEALPLPDPIFDENGNQLPATYANYLVTNNKVLVPQYGQVIRDEYALGVLHEVYSDREIVGINCNALIKQHGSLHCATMQLPKGTITKA